MYFEMVRTVPGQKCANRRSYSSGKGSTVSKRVTIYQWKSVNIIGKADQHLRKAKIIIFCYLVKQNVDQLLCTTNLIVTNYFIQGIISVVPLVSLYRSCNIFIQFFILFSTPYTLSSRKGTYVIPMSFLRLQTLDYLCIEFNLNRFSSNRRESVTDRQSYVRIYNIMKGINKDFLYTCKIIKKKS